MSETAYERGYRVASEHAASGGGGGGSSSSSARPPAGKGTVLFRQMGALPMWAWLVLGFVLILGISYWKSRKTATQPAPSDTTNTADIPQFVNQVYTNGAPPGEPGPKGPPGPPGPPGKPGTPPPKPKTPVTVASFKYTVKKGDTLLSLSQKFLGTTNRTALAHANGLGTGAGLRAGQIIIIPSHKSPPGALAPTPGPDKSGGATSGGSGGGGEGED